ncbi:MAG: acetate--CoA ligase family protein, partial [Patescibacteria group bacterium]
MSLFRLLNPASIAVIGASSNKKKLGNQILNNLIDGGYKGKIYPVNKKEGTIEGKKAYKSVKDITGKPDMALLVIPAQAVPEVLRECGEKGVKNTIIISAGFSERNDEGKKKEEEIKDIAEQYEMNILGPNCLGLINAGKNMNATFAAGSKRSAPLKSAGFKMAVISQSGAIGSAVLDWIQDKPLELSYFVSLGNKAGVDENDLLEFFASDKDTDAIALYLEEISDGGRFMEVVSRFSFKKPVIVLKAGLTEAGSRAGLSHTGSMTGSGRATTTGLKRAGALQVRSLGEFMDILELFGKKGKINPGKAYIVSNAGGPLVVMADELERNGIEMGEFTPRIEKNLSGKMPSSVALKNPLDIIGDADASRYQKALEAILPDNKIKNILILLTPQTSTEPEKTAEKIAEISKKHKDKLILASFIGGPSLNSAKDILRKSAVVHFEQPERAVRSLKNLNNFYSLQKGSKPYKYRNTPQFKKKNIQKDYIDSLRLLEQFNIPIVNTSVVENKKDLAGLSYPIALKGAGPNIIHKTDKELIALNIPNKKEAERIWKNFQRSLEKDDYCVAQPMISSGVEILLGFKRDEKFGPLLTVGAGGIYAEIMKDVQLEVDDVDMSRAKEMIKKLRIYPLLQGARGGEKGDIKELAKTIVK